MLFYKRLEEGRFKMPRPPQDPPQRVASLKPSELAMLLDGHRPLEREAEQAIRACLDAVNVESNLFFACECNARSVGALIGHEHGRSIS